MADTFKSRIVVEDVSWSPDGGLLGMALVHRSGDAPETVSAYLDVEQQRIEVIRKYPPLETDAPAWANAPRWSPDGDWLAFYSAVEGFGSGHGIWISDAQGVRPILTDLSAYYKEYPPVMYGAPSISPDGQWMAATASDGSIIFMQAGEWKPLVWPTTSAWRWVGWSAAP